MTSTEIEIILIEDSPSDAELIVRALRKRNLANKITRLKDGAEAVDFFFGQAGNATREMVPRVILLDLKLPKVDGIEVLRRIKSDDRTKNIPVVVLTSSNQESDVAAAYALGVNSYVTKPIRFDEFASAVAEVGAYWLMVNVFPSGDIRPS